jgi:hypothetical protein
VRFHHLVEINLHRQGKRSRAGRNVEHLPGAHMAKVARAFRKGKTGASFKSYQFAVTREVRFEDNGRAGNGHRDDVRINRAAAGILWHTEENRAGLNFRGPPCLAETEDRVRAEAGNSQIGEREFRARIAAGPHAGLFGDDIVHGRRSRVGFGGKKFNVADDLGDARFRRRSRNDWSEHENDEARNRAGQDSGGKIHLTSSRGGVPRMRILVEMSSPKRRLPVSLGIRQF